MPDYKKMYYQLFNCVSNAVKLLQEGQQSGEESYAAEVPPSLSVLEEAEEDPALYSGP